MKKFSLVLFAALFPILQAAAQETVTIDGINYSLENGEATISTQDESLSGDIVIPATVIYNDTIYTVTSAVDNAFSDTQITSIDLPSSITSLGDACFDYCSSLTAITLPNGITSLGTYCFYNCSSLSAISLPDGITELGYACFYGCSSLTKIELPSSITALGTYCFRRCSNLVSVTLPNSITELGYSCFEYCSSLTSIDLPEGITTLGDWCFSSCSSMTAIELPSKITSLGYACFAYCSSLSKVTCEWEDLTKVTTDSVVFYNIASPATLYVPKGTKEIYEATEPWSDFNSIVEYNVTVIVDNTEYTLENDEATITVQDENLSGDIVIPETITYEGESYTVTSVEDYAFANTKITSVSLPSSITSLGDYCFADCTDLTSIDLTDGSASAAKRARASAAALPASLISLGESCFSGCTSLTSIILPESLKLLGSYCFSGCTSLSEVTVGWNDLSDVSTGTGVFNGIASPATLYVPKGTKEIYEATEPWSDFTKIIELDVTAIEGVSLAGISLSADGGSLSISGLEDDASVQLYDLSGRMLSTAKASAGRVRLSTAGANGVVVVKIGGKSVKVAL